MVTEHVTAHLAYRFDGGATSNLNTFARLHVGDTAGLNPLVGGEEENNSLSEDDCSLREDLGFKNYWIAPKITDLPIFFRLASSFRF